MCVFGCLNVRVLYVLAVCLGGVCVCVCRGMCGEHTVSKCSCFKMNVHVSNLFSYGWHTKVLLIFR